MIKVASLWRNKDKDGNTFFSGSLGDLKILLFKSKSDHPQAPYFNMFLVEKERDYKRRGEDEGEEKTSRYKAKSPDGPDDFDDDEDNAPKRTKKADEDDDLPF